MAIDAHTHIHELGLNEVKKVLENREVLPVLTGHSPESNERAVEYGKLLNIPFVIGIAPQAAQQMSFKAIQNIVNNMEYLITTSKPNAIGEIGLDYHWAKRDIEKQRQIYVFKKMIGIAKEHRLPIVIHSRKSIDHALSIINELKFDEYIMLHFFSEIPNNKELLDSPNIIISIPTLHSKSRKKAIESTPIEQLVVETDSPYVAKTPEDVKKSIEYISSIKQIKPKEVEIKTSKNAAKIFNINVERIRMFNIKW